MSFRDAIEYTQDEIAKMAGVDPATVAKFAAERRADQQAAASLTDDERGIASSLGLSATEFVGLRDKLKPEERRVMTTRHHARLTLALGTDQRRGRS